MIGNNYYSPIKSKTSTTYIKIQIVPYKCSDLALAFEIWYFTLVMGPDGS